MYSGGMQRSASFTRFSKMSCSASAVERWNERIACPASVERAGGWAGGEVNCVQVAAFAGQDGGVLFTKRRCSTRGSGMECVRVQVPQANCSHQPTAEGRRRQVVVEKTQIRERLNQQHDAAFCRCPRVHGANGNALG